MSSAQAGIVSGGGLTLFQRILKTSAGFPLYTADRTTLALTKLAAWRNWNGADTLAQASAPLQCVTPAPSANFGGRYSAAFPAAPYYVSDAAASFWSFLNNGDGFAIVLAKTTTAGIQVILETTSASTTGISFRIQASNYNHLVYRSGALVGVGMTSAANTNANQLRVAIDATTQYLKKTGSAETSIPLTGTPSAPQTTLYLGARAGSFPVDGEVAGIFCGPAASRTQMAALLFQWSGVAV